MWLTRSNRRADVDPWQIGLHELWAERRIKMQDRRLGSPARPHKTTPAQLEGANRPCIGHLIDQLSAGGIVAVLQRLGEDQPEPGAASGRGPGLVPGRQHRLDALAPLGR